MAACSQNSPTTCCGWLLCVIAAFGGQRLGRHEVTPAGPAVRSCQARCHSNYQPCRCRQQQQQGCKSSYQHFHKGRRIADYRQSPDLDIFNAGELWPRPASHGQHQNILFVDNHHTLHHLMLLLTQPACVCILQQQKPKQATILPSLGFGNLGMLTSSKASSGGVTKPLAGSTTAAPPALISSMPSHDDVFDAPSTSKALTKA